MKLFLLFSCIVCFTAAVSSSVAVSVGGKAMLLQNNKQLINSDSGVKVEAVESFSNILARMLGGSVEGIENKPSSISGNIFYRPEANVVLVLEDEKQNILSNDDFKEMFLVKKNIEKEDVNGWCKLSGAMTEMFNNEEVIALTASYDEQYATSTNVARKDSVSISKTFTESGEELIQLPTITGRGNNIKYGFKDVVEHLKTNPHNIWNGLKMKVQGNNFIFNGGIDGSTVVTLVGHGDNNDRAFLSEIGIFSLILSDIKSNKIAMVEGTHSIVMVMSEMKAFLSKYPSNMAQSKVARNIVRTISKALIVGYSELFPNRLTAEVVVVKKMSHSRNSMRHEGRRLVENVGNKTSGYTNSQIEDYQVYLWSFLLLGFMLYLSIYSLMFMDIKEDPQLFATYLFKRPKQD
eukprot:g9330.t1